MTLKKTLAALTLFVLGTAAFSTSALAGPRHHHHHHRHHHHIHH